MDYKWFVEIGDLVIESTVHTDETQESDGINASMV